MTRMGQLLERNYSLIVFNPSILSVLKTVVETMRILKNFGAPNPLSKSGSILARVLSDACDNREKIIYRCLAGLHLYC